MARRAANQLLAEFDLGDQPRLEKKHLRGLAKELVGFDVFGKSTIVRYTHVDLADGSLERIATFVNEFWTSRQRQAANLHEISYRACFKPQLPRFFIERLTKPGNLVYDPFMGRGTTPLEAALMGRVPVGCDINPVATAMVGPRFAPPSLEEIEARIREIPFDGKAEMSADLLVFYHPETLAEISSLKRYLLERRESGARDGIDDWIEMVALNRLTGHSPGFFSVYTLPPNQAVSAKAQRKINADRDQTPPRRDVPKLILKKSKQLLNGLEQEQFKALMKVAGGSMTLTSLAKDTPEIADASVSLVVTSPPFLDVVDYHTDNWLRCWFLGIDSKSVNVTMSKIFAHGSSRWTRSFASCSVS